MLNEELHEVILFPRYYLGYEIKMSGLHVACGTCIGERRVA
jgi:hypothetical protein